MASALSNRQNCACARKTLHTQQGRTHGAGCVRQWFRTAEPLGERRYENGNTHTHASLRFHRTHQADLHVQESFLLSISVLNSTDTSKLKLFSIIWWQHAIVKKLIAWHSPIFGVPFLVRKLLSLLRSWFTKTYNRKRANWQPENSQIVIQQTFAEVNLKHYQPWSVSDAPRFRHYPLILGLGFLGLHRRPMFYYYFFKLLFIICNFFYFWQFMSHDHLRALFDVFHGGVTPILKFRVLTPLLTSRLSCLSPWARQNFYSIAKIWICLIWKKFFVCLLWVFNILYIILDNLVAIFWERLVLLFLLLCSHSHNDAPPPRTSAERIHSRSTGRRASIHGKDFFLAFGYKWCLYYFLSYLMFRAWHGNHLCRFLSIAYLSP